MDTVFSYVYRRPNISSGNGRVTPDAPTSMIPCTPPRPTNDDQADDESEIFLTPESRLPYEDCSGRRGNPERPSLILQPDSLSTSKIKVPSLFSPLVSKKLLDESREAEISSSVPVTPEGLRPRPTVVEMRAIFCLDQKPTSYQNHHSIGNLTDLKSVAAQDRHRASILPSISDLDLVIYNAANSMSLSVLTQSPQIQRKRERTTRMSPPPYPLDLHHFIRLRSARDSDHVKPKTLQAWQLARISQKASLRRRLDWLWRNPSTKKTRITSTKAVEALSAVQT